MAINDHDLDAALRQLSPSDTNEAKGRYVRFFMQPLHMTHMSEEEGREIYENREMIEIVPKGGGNTLVFHDFADNPSQKYKERFALEYQRFKNGEERNWTGTPLTSWAGVNAEMARQLNWINIYTVEQLAEGGERAIQNIGAGGREIVAKARAWLESSKDNAAFAQLTHQNEVLEQQVKQLTLDMQRMAESRDARMEEMVAKMEKLVAEPPKRGPGRPKKQADNETPEGDA